MPSLITSSAPSWPRPPRPAPCPWTASASRAPSTPPENTAGSSFAYPSLTATCASASMPTCWPPLPQSLPQPGPHTRHPPAGVLKTLKPSQNYPTLILAPFGIQTGLKRGWFGVTLQPVDTLSRFGNQRSAKDCARDNFAHFSCCL